MNPVFTKTVTILPSQLDAWGRLSLAHTFDLFMDTATEAAGAMGVGWDFLMRRGLFWITVKSRVRMIDPPRLLETVQVVTWPLRPGEMRCERRYEIRRGDAVLVEGLTEWAIVSMQDGKPRPLAGILPEDMAYPDEPAPSEPFPMIAGDFADPPFAEHRVAATDIDLARHMNNVAYVRAIVNAFPLKAWKALDVKQMDVIFLASAREGDTLGFQQRRDGGALDIRGGLPDGRTSVLARLSVAAPPLPFTLRANGNWRGTYFPRQDHPFDRFA